MILTDPKLQKLLGDTGQDKASCLLTILCSLTEHLESDPEFARRRLKGRVHSSSDQILFNSCVLFHLVKWFGSIELGLFSGKIKLRFQGDVSFGDEWF